MTQPGQLQGFVYAEDRDGTRSLGFKLLAPTSAAWAREVESLARSLQSCPYPEAWPAADLFCSVLLDGGQRVAGFVRYGLRDHTAGQRPGGLEFLGVVGPAGMTFDEARAVAAWLRRRRVEVDDPRSLAGAVSPGAVSAAPPLPDADAALLPLRLAHPGAVVISAASAEQPERQLGLLKGVGAGWQWLPLCGPDFPLEAYARRGPLVAWTPLRVDLAVFMSPPRIQSPAAAAPRRSALSLVLAAFLVAVAALNLWAWLTLPGRLASHDADVTRPRPGGAPSAPLPALPSAAASTEARERFGAALHRLAASRAGPDFAKSQAALCRTYQKLLEANPDLQVEDARAQAAVAALAHWAGYSPERVSRLIVEEFADRKGIDPEVILLISERIRQRLQKDL